MKKGWGLQNSRSRMIALFIVDMLTVVLDSYLAIILRFKLDNIWVPEEYMSSVEHYMIINVITTVIIFLLLNLYNRVWSYASLYEMLLIVCAAMLSTAFQAFWDLVCCIYRSQEAIISSTLFCLVLLH